MDEIVVKRAKDSKKIENPFELNRLGKTKRVLEQNRSFFLFFRNDRWTGFPSLRSRSKIGWHRLNIIAFNVQRDEGNVNHNGRVSSTVLSFEPVIIINRAILMGVSETRAGTMFH